MKQRKHKRFFILFLFILLACTLGYKTKAYAAKAYFSVEKFTIGQGYLVEPVEVEIKDNEPASTVTERVLKQAGYTCQIGSAMGWYLAGINKADNGNSSVPICIQNMAEDAPKTGDLLPAREKNNYYPGLYEFSYSANAGWMFFINNKDMPVGAANFYLKDGDVVRLRFTLYGIGADLGNGRTGSLSLPNLDAITKRMAVYNANRKICDAKGYASVYASAKSIVTNMDSTPTQVEQAYAKLPTEAQMIQWAAEQAAKEKAEADRQKYTPAKTKIKKITSKKKQAKLTWKKITGATGYEIQMSKKKASGFKKIATIKKAKTVTYTKKKLKSRKTMYFRVRAYRKVGKITYYGAYSAVKKIKIK